MSHAYTNAPVGVRRRTMLALSLLVASFTLTACDGGQGGADATEEPQVTVDENLFPEGKFVSAADVYAADQAGVDVVFVDARTELDFSYGHIPEAINVPYFAPEEHLEDLPKDRWIVTYCECPHAEAEQVADALLANGFTHVRVIDEGLQGWREVGGEVVAGEAQDG